MRFLQRRRQAAAEADDQQFLARVAACIATGGAHDWGAIEDDGSKGRVSSCSCGTRARGRDDNAVMAARQAMDHVDRAG